MLELKEEEDNLDNEDDDDDELEEEKNQKLFSDDFFQRARNQQDDNEKQGDGEESEDGSEEGDGEVEVEHLFGKIMGIERLMLINKNDNLRDFIEKVSAIPENKLAYIENQNGQINLKSLVSLSDIFQYIGQKS